jgi:CRISPR/Cas system-associated exonuclease Cas4 (RecB family)
MKVVAKVLPTKDKSNVNMTLSVSKLKTFDEDSGGCRKKFKFCYIDKLPRIDRDFHIFGKYLHQVLENFHRAILDNPELGKDWHPVLKSAWDAAYDEYSGQLTGLQVKEAKEIIDEYKKILEEDGLPEVIGVEKDFYITLNDKVLLNGFIDRIQIDPDGMLHVADYKTTKDPKYLKDFFQLMTYCYALCMEDESINRVRASFILLRHNFDYLTQEYTREEVVEIAEKFLKTAYAIEEEKLWRPNPQFLCKYCDYLEHCNEGTNYLVKRGVLKDKPKKKPFVGIRKW